MERPKSKWIWIGDDYDKENPVIVYFRKELQLEQKPDRAVICLTADSRYRFFVNGISICQGPCKGDDQVWYYDEVRRARETGLIDGTSDTTYEPEATLTVAQAIKLAAALHQMEKEGTVSLTNGEEVWYSTYVDYAVANDIVEETYADYAEWQMNKRATRAEFVHIFYGAKKTYPAKNTVADGAVPDVKMDDPYADEIYTFYRAGILTGSDVSGVFMPNGNIKRSEMAAILIRMFDDTARQSVTLK